MVKLLGYLPYMRTDGMKYQMKQLEICRNYKQILRTNIYFSKEIRNYSGKKAKKCSGVHEAVRPTDIKRTPNNLRSILDRDQNKIV